MDYQRHYNALMKRAAARELLGYGENHHIVPKCVGGGNGRANIVRLTPEEHFLAHQLLVKIYPGHRGLLWAAVAMTNGTAKHQRSNKLYGWLRREFAKRVGEASLGRKHSQAARAKMSASRTGVKRGPHSEATRTKMSAAAIGKAKSAEHVASMSASKTGKKVGPKSAASRAKASESMKLAAVGRDNAKYQTPEYREKQAASMRQIWALRSTKK